MVSPTHDFMFPGACSLEPPLLWALARCAWGCAKRKWERTACGEAGRGHYPSSSGSHLSSAKAITTLQTFSSNQDLRQRDPRKIKPLLQVSGTRSRAAQEAWLRPAQQQQQHPGTSDRGSYRAHRGCSVSVRPNLALQGCSQSPLLPPGW